MHGTTLPNQFNRGKVLVDAERSCEFNVRVRVTGRTQAPAGRHLCRIRAKDGIELRQERHIPPRRSFGVWWYGFYKDSVPDGATIQLQRSCVTLPKVGARRLPWV